MCDGGADVGLADVGRFPGREEYGDGGARHPRADQRPSREGADTRIYMEEKRTSSCYAEQRRT